MRFSFGSTTSAVRPTKRARRGLGLVLSVVFIVVGGVLAYFFLVRPVGKVLAARAWPAVPCVVESSEVREHSGDDGPTYSVEIAYRYDFTGREWKASRYDFMGGSSSGRRGKSEIVAQYPPGSERMCFVNPSAPGEAVIVRGFTPLVGLLPLVFIIVGVVAFVSALREKNPALRAGHPPTGPLVLKPSLGPLTKFFGTLAVALFWNGITSVFVYQVIEEWRSGSPEWFLTVFLIPFVTIGLGMFFFAGKFLLALGNPRIRLTAGTAAPRLGTPLELSWLTNGRLSALRRLRFTLEGREEATYRRGTSDTTDRETFAILELADMRDPRETRSGSCSVVLPRDTMSSFEAAANKIVWAVKVRGEIPNWPDVEQEHRLALLPVAGTRSTLPTGRVEPSADTSGATMEITLGQSAFLPGDVLTGVAAWHFPKTPRDVEVRLVWSTRGKGTQDAAIVAVEKVERPEVAGRHEFEFQLPEEPASFSGKLISLVWAVELVAKGVGEVPRADFVLSPTGREILLGQPSTTAPEPLAPIRLR